MHTLGNTLIDNSEKLKLVQEKLVSNLRLRQIKALEKV